MDNKNERVRRQRIGMAIAIVFLAIILLIAFAQQQLSGRKYEDTVKNASPTEFQDKTYGAAFDSFFSNNKWEVFQQQNKSYIVQFSGVGQYKSGSGYTLIQFMVGDVPDAAASSSGSDTAASSGNSASSSSSEVQIHVSPITSTDDVHIIYMGVNEKVLDAQEQEALLQEIFS